MSSLHPDLRARLEKVVIDARDVAEEAARASVERLGVGHHEPYRHLSPDERRLRVALRARGKQAGDARDKSGRQQIDHLVHEVAYAHWHRMLFARFLAENHLLIHPELNVAVSLDECDELARDENNIGGAGKAGGSGGSGNGRKIDAWTIAGRFASRMLPQIFRPDDCVLALALAPEHQVRLEKLLESLPAEVFTADDSLGWVYQFWQSKRKDEVNKSGKKITGDTLPAVTQLFTEDYMVLFLLHNTLGAWWAGKQAVSYQLSAVSEDDCRKAVALPDIEWEYLRFIREGDGDDSSPEPRTPNPVPLLPPNPEPRTPNPEPRPWRPAAGTFDGWPKAAADIKVLDPCMGSGHFLVFALPILVALRMEEEGLTKEQAVLAVLRDNLFGLELDARCTQIAAFNLALASWKMIGRHVPLGELNLACSGIGPQATVEEWIELASRSPHQDRRTPRWMIEDGLKNLHRLFSQAPELGSLIDPKVPGDLVAAGYEVLLPFLDSALLAEELDYEAHERAVSAQGIVKAAEMLAADYTLVCTNVPYLGREGHAEVLQAFARSYREDAAADLCTLFLNRCLDFAESVVVVLPQNWWIGRDYRFFRERLLKTTRWRVAVVLGEEAWWTYRNRGPNTVLSILDSSIPTDVSFFQAMDVSTKPGSTVVSLAAKERALRGIQQPGYNVSPTLHPVLQSKLLDARDCRITIAQLSDDPPLSTVADSGEGSSTGDNDRFVRQFWEMSSHAGWMNYCGPGFKDWLFCDCSQMIWWEDGRGDLANSKGARIQNCELWDRQGILVGRVRGVTATLFAGGCFTKGAVLVCPKQQKALSSLFSFLRSDQYEKLVRKLDPRVSAATSVVTDVPFRSAEWEQRSSTEYPHGLPEPESDDLTQWLFHGRPERSTNPLQVAVARLLGYRWPAELDKEMRLSKEARALVERCRELDKYVDADGVVPIPVVSREQPADKRLWHLLAAAYGKEWSPGRLDQLLAEAGCKGRSLEDWLRDKFFEQHFALFHHRPFVWHIWDGRKDGFALLVNYHKLTAGDGAGAKLLEKITYSYLGDWIARQRGDAGKGVAGADLRLAAAQELQGKLEAIARGEPPYDIFVRWKPLAAQPIGWHPDINDGVRMNIRPFVEADILRKRPNINWKKDRGKDPESAPWFKVFKGERINDHHLTVAEKEEARAAAGGNRKTVR